MKTALLLLEIQNDYFPDGRIPLENSEAVSQKTQIILETYRENQLPIIHVQHISTNPDAKYLLPCTRGTEFHKNVQPISNEVVIKKHYSNSFKDTMLKSCLLKNNIDHLVICGMMTHLTVDTTVRAAFDFGFHCSILYDACATHELIFNQIRITAQNVQFAFLAALQSHYAQILSVAEYIQKASLTPQIAELP